jgi:pyruvate/2-oxoglutarate dehydrogenase complex dihydrolipoamide dehydrogenase (E3) component
VAANLLDGQSRRVSDRITAYNIYTDPPLDRAGLTEAQARKSGRNVLMGQLPMTQVGRAVEKGETRGFIKILVDGGSQQFLCAPVNVKLLLPPRQSRGGLPCLARAFLV